MNNFLQNLLGMQNYRFQNGVGSRVKSGYSDPQSLDNIVNAMRVSELRGEPIKTSNNAVNASFPRTKDTNKLVAFKGPQGEDYIMPDQAYGNPKEGYYEMDPMLELVKGLTAVPELAVDKDTMDRYIANAAYYAGTPAVEKWPGQYPFRQPDTMAENAKYVSEYLRAIMTLAPYYNLPPKTVAGMLMQESGWGGQRFDGNLGGAGFLEGGADLGIRFPGETPKDQANAYLKGLSQWFGGRYQGARTPGDFHNRGYNQHEEYPGAVQGIINMLEAK